MKIKKSPVGKSPLIILFVIVSNCLFSQINNYKPFPLNYGTWILEYYDYTVQFYPTNLTRYEANHDTIIGSNSYKKVTAASFIGTPPYGGVIPYGPSTFQFAYRNDIPNKKVYIWTQIAGQYKDTLWYDFNLNIGDTLKPIYSFDTTSGFKKIIVTSIDSVLICNEYHKRYLFDCDANLVEGIGFTDNFISTYNSQLCYFEPGYLYGTNFYCTVTSVKDVLPYSIDQIKYFPNPSNGSLTIDIGKADIKEIQMTDLLGNIIFQCRINYQTEFHIENLASGTYILTFIDRDDRKTNKKIISCP
jgi:hypothetical protein